MAKATRIIWKGAISFGLVHVPVALAPASTSNAIDFDWLDKRSLDPVGYKRINKRTGREIDKAHIVKGIKVDGGRYVVLGDDQIKAAYPKTTQTIAIETFVKAPEVPFVYLEAPYYLEPAARGEKVYALLREAMIEAGVIGIARVVMHTKEHLAALVPAGPALVLNTLRWAADLRPPGELKFPPQGKTGIKDAELKMARRLIDDMTGPFEPEQYSGQFEAAVHALVKQRIEAGDTAEVQPLEEPAGGGERGDNVVDLTELLARSLGQRKPPARKSKSGSKTAARKRA